MLKVYTAQYRYSGKDRLDITVAGKDAFGRFFAPGWSMVKGLKSKAISEYEYERAYHDKMLDSWHKHKHVWDQLLAMDEVTLVCFCRPGEFCHRLLLAKYLEKLGAVHMGERDLTNGQQILTATMDILNVQQGVICQQVNCRGVMGAGLAKQIRDKWPYVYKVYRKAFEEWGLYVGNMHLVPINPGAYGKYLLVANLCGQDRYGRDLTGSNIPIFFPYGMGCVNAGGDWYLVHCIIKNIFPDAIIVRK